MKQMELRRNLEAVEDLLNRPRSSYSRVIWNSYREYWIERLQAAQIREFDRS